MSDSIQKPDTDLIEGSLKEIIDQLWDAVATAEDTLNQLEGLSPQEVQRLMSGVGQCAREAILLAETVDAECSRGQDDVEGEA